MSTVCIAAALAVAGAVCFALCNTAKPLLTAAKSAGSGLARLLLVNLTSGYTGCYIVLNFATVFIATVLSVPGVVGMLFMKLLFNY